MKLNLLIKNIVFLILFFCAQYSTAQDFINNKVKAQYIASFGRFLEWDKHEDADFFKIGIYGNDSAMHKDLHSTLTNKKFKKKPVKLIHYSKIKDIEAVQILFIDEGYCDDLKRIYNKLKGKQVLIVTNRCESTRETMINFLPLFFVRIDINKFNLEKEGFEAPVLLSAIAGEYTPDFKNLYTETEDSLKAKRETINKQLKEIEEKQKNIANLNNTLLNQAQLVKEKEEELNKFSYQIKKQEDILDEKMVFIKEQESKIERHIKSINVFKEQSELQEADIKKQEEILAKRKAEIQKQDQQIESQKSTLNRVFKEMEMQKLIGYFITIVSILLLILTISLFYFYKNKKKANAVLTDMNSKISNQKEIIEEKNTNLNRLVKEVTEQKDEIEAQRDEIEAQRDTVELQKDKIEEIHLEILNSLDYATRLQQSILPKESILKKHLNDLFVLFKPKDKVSGDFFWWTHIEGHTVVTAADCTGHGVPGAFMSMLGISFLREIVQKEYITHPGVILRRLRKEIIRSLNQTGASGTHKDGMDMALISINHSTKELQFSGANNPLYIVRKGVLEFENDAIKTFDHSPSDFNLYEIRPDKMPIAIYEKMDKFNTHTLTLEEGDQIYLFSDGFADQFGGPKGKKFKYKPFKKILLENAELPMTEQNKILFDAFKDWKGKEEQVDDLVILGLKI